MRRVEEFLDTAEFPVLVGDDWLFIESSEQALAKQIRLLGVASLGSAGQCVEMAGGVVVP